MEDLKASSISRKVSVQHQSKEWLMKDVKDSPKLDSSQGRTATQIN